jgi:membrane-associated phospholipid phosphatase
MRQGPFLAWPGWRQLRFAWVLSLAGVLWFAWVYAGADALTAHRATRVRVHLDAEFGIPFIPEAVVIYMSIYPLFLAAPFIIRERNDFFALSMTMNLVVLVGGICFLALPAQLAFAPPKDLGAFPGLFRFADRLNLTYNLVPSLHVALSTLCIAAFAPRANRTGRVLLWLWAIAVALSTLLTHQHHVLDVVAGFALALAGYRFIYLRRFGRGNQPQMNTDRHG